MITLQKSTNGGIELRSEDRSPSVYLDHWAFRQISEDDKLRKQFVDTLKEKKGTLSISWLNFTEFAKVDEKQKRVAENFIDSVLPNIVFLEVAPFVVIEREKENALLAGAPPAPPHIDAEYAKVLLIDGANSLTPLSANGLLEDSSSPELVECCKSYVKSIIDRTEQLRKEVANDQQRANGVKNFVYREVVPRGTRQLVRAMLRSLVLNRELKMTANHAMDLTHTVVPVSYCDFVLLDSHWVTQVEQARIRMKKDGVLKFPLAKVYSGKKNGITRFLDDLKIYSSSKDDLRKAV